MLIIYVSIHVKPDRVEDFKSAILDNARNSVREPGVVRFDVLQQQDDPTWFMIYEAYRTPDDHARHRETAHYKKWRDTVEEMMAEPRKGIKYTNVFPDEGCW
jgi:quinol monooxygenase YgiN